VKIGDDDIGYHGQRPYLIAEVAGEHRGKKERALRLINSVRGLADAVKFQCFDPQRLTEARGGNREIRKGLWKGRMLLDLYQETQTPWAWFPELFDYARQCGLTLFASIFDDEGIDYLETLNCPAYKIASFDVTNLRLIQKAASTGKPVIISTGMASDKEVQSAYDAANLDNAEFTFLHCVSAYPCPIEEANLSRMKWLAFHYNLDVGISDHSKGWFVPALATVLGAKIIEKHITLARDDGGPDAPYSLTPSEYHQMVEMVHAAHAALAGKGKSQNYYRRLRVKA
jgi:sialic acid synthase SpsE